MRRLLPLVVFLVPGRRPRTPGRGRSQGPVAAGRSRTTPRTRTPAASTAASTSAPRAGGTVVAPAAGDGQLRRDRAGERQVGHDRDRGRLFRHAHASRLDRRRQGRHGRRGGRRSARSARAARPRWTGRTSTSGSGSPPIRTATSTRSPCCRRVPTPRRAARGGTGCRPDGARGRASAGRPRPPPAAARRPIRCRAPADPPRCAPPTVAAGPARGARDRRHGPRARLAARSLRRPPLRRGSSARAPAPAARTRRAAAASPERAASPLAAAGRRADGGARAERVSRPATRTRPSRAHVAPPVATPSERVRAPALVCNWARAALRSRLGAALAADRRRRAAHDRCVVAARTRPGRCRGRRLVAAPRASRAAARLLGRLV